MQQTIGADLADEAELACRRAFGDRKAGPAELFFGRAGQRRLEDLVGSAQTSVELFTLELEAPALGHIVGDDEGADRLAILVDGRGIESGPAHLALFRPVAILDSRGDRFAGRGPTDPLPEELPVLLNDELEGVEGEQFLPGVAAEAAHQVVHRREARAAEVDLKDGGGSVLDEVTRLLLTLADLLLEPFAV